MKILQIRMENFGPYVDETITREDFSNLNEQRLFLLEGKTGCGKSTIIEGVVFALYGKDSKGRTEGVRRNSAPAKKNATVTLEFEVEGVAYRVVRSPQMTDSETGKKLKSQKVNLAEIDSDGNVIAGRTWDAVREVEAKIMSIIRLNANQFARIVVLPQGQFSKFLRSKSEEKQALLEAIFPIGEWKEIKKGIKAQSDQARKKENELKDAAKQAAAVTKRDTNPESDSLDEDVDRIKTIDEVRTINSEAEAKISEWTTLIESKEEELGKRRKEVDTQKKSLDEQEKLNKAIKERENIIEEKKKLDKLEKSIKPKEAALAKHHDAARLKGVLSSLVSAKAAVKENEKDIDEHLKDAGIDASLKEKSPTEIKQLLDAIASNAKIVQDICKDQKSKKELSESLDGLVEAEKSARDWGKELLFQQHKAWASQIAKKSLSEGDPCLVCGSKKHPTPADGDEHEDSELEEALAAQTLAEDKWKGAKVEISRLTDSIKEKRGELKLGEGDEIPDVSNLEKERDAHQELYNLKLTGVTLATTENTAQKAWMDAENTHNLDTMDKIDALILESDLMEKFTESISQFNKRRILNTNGLQKPEIIDSEGKKVVDISKNLVTLKETTTTLNDDEQVHKTSKTLLSALESSNSKLSKTSDEYTQFATGVADLHWVDDHLRGVNTGGKMKMDIIAWILRHWFEKALEYANTRLAEIGSGRYSLELAKADKDEKKSDRTGLNIGVIDALSDSLKPRSTVSLSGGESFYISLALALGMSDVVSDEAGGIQLGTLFIDEGFGTLDQDTLDDVMGVIDDIGENNRVIGLISHVESLKQRISSRISVTKKGDGNSTTKVEV